MPSKTSQRKRKSHRGGSPASQLVMDASVATPLTTDIIPRTGDIPSCQSGSGQASDMVMSNLLDDAKTVAYPESQRVAGDINSLNTYQITGGSKKNRNSKHKHSKRTNSKHKHSKRKHSKCNNKTHNNKNSKNRRSMRGGSDWISSQYSLGPVNNPDAATTGFSTSSGVPNSMLMNPPNMGLAGSGSEMSELEGANVRNVGAPLI